METVVEGWEPQVSDLSSLLREIPDELKPLAALGIGAFILVGLVLFHGAGLHHILVWRKRVERRLLLGRPHLLAAAVFFASAVFLMLTLHIAEIFVWSFLLTHLGLIERIRDSIYFCANAYTTVGYGQVALEDKWRNISPIIAFSGLFTFAWTTSSLVDLVRAHSQIVEQLEEERVKELGLRRSLRTDELGALSREKDAEREDRERARKEAASGSFFDRRKVWKEEKQRAKKLRDVERAEIEALRRKEQSDEETLGPGAPPADSSGKK
jgi:Ion channel